MQFEAVHDFNPLTNGEIELKQGDVIVMNRAPPDQNEWWNGVNTRTQQQGYFPGNYVKPLVQVYSLPVVPPRPPRRERGEAGSGAEQGTPAVTPTQPPVVEALELKDQIWYWGQCSRDEVNDSMRDKCDGTFLVRDAIQTPGQYTLTLRKAGVNKLIRILHKEGKYGFSHPLEYSCVPQLVQFFKDNSLSHYNSGLDTKLTQPLPRPLARGENLEGGKNLEENYNNIRNLIEELSKTFEIEANRKTEYVERIDIVAKIQTAQQEVITWLKNQELLLQQRAQHSSAQSADCLNTQLRLLREQQQIEKNVLDDLGIKCSLAQNKLRKIDGTLKQIKLEIKEKSRLHHELDRQVRLRGDDPEKIRSHYLEERSDYHDCEHPGYEDLPPQPLPMAEELEMATYLRQGLSREDYRQVLLNKPDGTFLIRPSIHKPGYFTLDIVVQDEIKKVSIIHENSMYGLVIPTTFSTITQLVEHYRRTSLREHNRQLDTFLRYPAFDPRFSDR